MKTVTKTTLRKMSVFALIEKIVDVSSDLPLETDGLAKPYIVELADRLQLSPMQALMLSVFVDQCDDHRIGISDLARHFSCRNINVLSVMSDIDQLVNAKLIRRHTDDDGSFSFRVPMTTVKSLMKGELPKPLPYKVATPREWISRISDLFNERGNDEISDDCFYREIATFIDENQQFDMCRKLRSFQFKDSDLVCYLAIALCFINNNDERVCRHDLSDYFDRTDLNGHCAQLEAGNHILQEKLFVEYSCCDGTVETSNWHLTSYSKCDVFADLNLKRDVANVRSNLTHYETISPKKLYYSADVTSQVEQLASLLEKERMERILKRLGDKGMRKGFTCLFYGGPGTGKTETVLQLAKRTGRDLMMVDVPSIRSKWVGETEKNIKEVFDRYRKSVKESDIAPILVFNEADALLNRRNEGSVGSVDKMENAMQNIILQEMENLEGIMIATTNLTGSLDPAFERRFLFKVHFEKPTPKERHHIWQAMLPELSNEDALSLAERFDFSGGQIENIARKRIIDDILCERDVLDLPSIVESCKRELLNKKNQQRVGFAS